MVAENSYTTVAEMPLSRKLGGVLDVTVPLFKRTFFRWTDGNSLFSSMLVVGVTEEVDSDHSPDVVTLAPTIRQGKGKENYYQGE